jgi:hypothetical protein
MGLVTKILGWAAFLATIVFGVLPWFHVRRLAIELVSRTALIDKSQPGQSSLKIKLDGISVPQVYSDVLSISNPGDEPIRASDFEGPIHLEYAGGSYVRTTIADLEPSDLPVHFETADAAITLAPLLLNPGDKIKIEILTTSLPAPTVRGRIAGINRVALLSKTGQEIPLKYHSPDFTVGLLLIGISAVLFSLVPYKVSCKGKSDPLQLLRGRELCACCIVILLGGFALMDYGARNLGLYGRVPSLMAFHGLLAVLMTVSLLLFWQTRPKGMSLPRWRRVGGEQRAPRMGD